MLVTVVILSVFSCVRVLGGERTTRLFALFLAGVVFASLLAGLLSAQGRHQFGETDLELVGAWRGIFVHKNQAGFAAACSVMAAWFMFKRTSRRFWLAVLIASVALLILSRSKTSMGLLVPSVAIGGLFEYANRSSKSKLMVATAFFGLGLLFVLAFVGYSGELAGMVDQPDSFTGRGAIWAASGAMISDRPLLGFGYGSVFLVGSNSPWFDYASAWAVNVTHGHNGYLDVLAATGMVGLVLILLAFVVDPIKSLVSMPRSESVLVGFLSSLLVFVVLHNTMESSLMERARPEWVTLLLVGAVARRSTVTYRSGVL